MEASDRDPALFNNQSGFHTVHLRRVADIVRFEQTFPVVGLRLADLMTQATA
jgi:hypothetical protein